MSDDEIQGFLLIKLGGHRIALWVKRVGAVHGEDLTEIVFEPALFL
jgi:hypothetical protein